jgi:stage II sporulation protein M
MTLFHKIIQIYRSLLSDNRPWFRKTLIWFGFGAILGGITFFITVDLLSEILGIFEDKFGPSPAFDFNLVMGIFTNNLTASAVALFGGLLLGLGPFVVVVSNGFLLGYILIATPALSGQSFVSSLGIVVLGILPHGILEIPAFLLAAALGLRLGIEWLKKENYGRRIEVLRGNFLKVLVAIPAIALLLFVAALIEVYVTGTVLDVLSPEI